jgi:hypothetical protein
MTPGKRALQSLLYPREEAGMKVALIGFLIAMVGATIAFLLHFSIGYLVTVCGILAGLGGIFWHWKVNFLE